MNVQINGEARSVPEEVSLAGALEALGVPVEFVAVALNQTFVPRSRYATTALVEGDEIEVVAPQQGG